MMFFCGRLFKAVVPENCSDKMPYIFGRQGKADQRKYKKRGLCSGVRDGVDRPGIQQNDAECRAGKDVEHIDKDL